MEHDNGLRAGHLAYGQIRTGRPNFTTPVVPLSPMEPMTERQ
jgi:hypothetical protein